MILKIRFLGISIILTLSLITVVLFQNIVISANPSIKAMANIPMPKIEEPLRLLTPSNEIFNIASCKTKDIAFTIAEVQVPPGGGPPPHVHYFINEWFWTPKGGVELFHSTRQYPSIEEVPIIEDAGRADMYSIISKPNQLIYSPNFYVHGYVNPTKETLPLISIWLKNDIAPVFPHDDGGMRDFFTETGMIITDLNNIPQWNKKNDFDFDAVANRHGMNHSTYFMEYVNSVSNQFPSELEQMQNDQDLQKVIEAVEAFNRGDQSVSCF